jgi:nickel transport protein
MSTRSTSVPLLLGAAMLMVGRPAIAHEVLHSIERGRAVAVKAFFADGEALAYSAYLVFSPADAKIPYQKGRTDRSGYLAFVPDVPGPWHVRVSEASGHGFDLDVPVEAMTPAAGKTSAASSADIASWAFALRPLVGAALVVGLFATLRLFYRRKEASK